MALGSGLSALVASAVVGVGAVAGGPSGAANPPAPQARTPATSVDAAWVWPLDPEPRVVRGFDPPDQPWGAWHRGVDLATAVGGPACWPDAVWSS